MTERGVPGTGSDRDPLAELCYRLKRLYRRSGEPSTREIARRTDAISHTTVSVVLRCAKLPRWGQLEMVVEALGGDVGEFNELWVAARDYAEDPTATASTIVVDPRSGDQGGTAATAALTDETSTHASDKRETNNVQRKPPNAARSKPDSPREATSAPLTAAGLGLGARLRSLREDTGLTQRQLARILGGEGSMVSVWETSRRIPPQDRLRTYARLFATPRSFSRHDSPRLIDDEDLTEEERRRFRELEGELLNLRNEALASGDRAWLGPVPPHRVFLFNDGAPITIACAEVAEADRPRYADPRDLNYVRASSFADLDALLDLYAHLRTENPTQSVRIRAAGELRREEMAGHVILLGGSVHVGATGWLANRVGLPLRWASLDGEEIFEIARDHDQRRFNIRRDGDALLEDVGVFARAPNPLDPQHTITICNGLTTRGVRGVVQCFADSTLRGRNEHLIATRFAGHTSYGLLMSVEVLPTNGESLTPDLSEASTRLYEWAY